MAKYSSEDVRMHTSEESLWIVHQGKVYDVTKFLRRHPGGPKILAKRGGKDVTETMRTIPHAHSAAAYSILKKYYIGDLADDISQSTEDTQKVAGNGRANKRVADDVQNGCVTANNKPMVDQQQPGARVITKGCKEEDLVDWSQPIFWQVGKLGKHYNEWVHSPVDGHLRLFHSDFVEYFSATSWWVIPLLWIPVVLILFFCGFQNLLRASISAPAWLPLSSSMLAVAVAALLFVLGLIMWTLVEYTLHRWLFHMDPPTNSPFLITVHFILHGQHHKAPFDKERLVFPPVPAAGFLLFFWSIFSSFLPLLVTQILFSGALLGYICYDLTHYYLHHGTPSIGYFKRLKSYHVKHHFVDQKKGFGISSKLWDYPFNTLIENSAESSAPYNNNNKKTT